jgi:hypothetical protein
LGGDGRVVPHRLAWHIIHVVAADK